MLDFVKFNYCPRCGEACLQANDAKSFVCLACGLVYYHATCAVVSALVAYEDKIILTRRANEPQKGLWGLPGGFVDYEESLETAAYLCSDWERYLSREVLYFCSIAFFVVQVNDIAILTPGDDVEAFQLIQPGLIDHDMLAFQTDKVALERYRKLIAIQ
jgi:ribosomal protein S27AE